MNPDSAASSLLQWRTLRVRRTARILQVFSETSPESWWWSRYLPSRSEADIQTISISRLNYRTQINLALAECSPKFVLFHRRTLTSRVFREVAGGFEVTPLFVVPGVNSADTNPTCPLTSWLEVLQDARSGLCRLVAENRVDVEELDWLDVGASYLPPLVQLPEKLKTEGKSASEFFRVVLVADSYPAAGLVGALMGISRLRFSSQPIKLILSLGEGHDSTQSGHRNGVLAVAHDLFPVVEEWPWVYRTEFLQLLAKHADAVVAPEFSPVGVEASLLEIPAWVYRGGTLSEFEWDEDWANQQKHRTRFWGRL